MKYILGRKIEMTQTWTEKGRVVPVTIIEAGPCTVTQIRTKEKDGYTAVQVGFGARKIKNVSKALKGHYKELIPMRFVKEFRGEAQEGMTRGSQIDVSVFAPGEFVKVTGVSKGQGFQGVVKRHRFHGHPATHGHKDQLRMPGAIGAGGLQHVRKGMRMAGRMGGEQITVSNLEVISVDKEKNRLMLKGAVPGARNSLVTIIGQ
ncbi:MAG: 50S ribosomal protein L3 [bacterium]|nr:50S ribosomal protein L3 [bacterium]